MASFDEILNGIHPNGIIRDDSNDASNVITITDQRVFEVPNDFNLIIGYAGDVNSQIITFAVPCQHEGHALDSCTNHIILWKNLTSGVEGNSTLRLADLEF